MKINAVYHPSFGQYQGNPLIEALPPVREFSEVKNALKSTITINPSEKHESGVVRGHLIAQLMNNFFNRLHGIFNWNKNSPLCFVKVT